MYIKAPDGPKVYVLSFLVPNIIKFLQVDTFLKHHGQDFENFSVSLTCQKSAISMDSVH